jgi:hypothetical protein
MAKAQGAQWQKPKNPDLKKILIPDCVRVVLVRKPLVKQGSWSVPAAEPNPLPIEVLAAGALCSNYSGFVMSVQVESPELPLASASGTRA